MAQRVRNGSLSTRTLLIVASYCSICRKSAGGGYAVNLSGSSYRWRVWRSLISGGAAVHNSIF